jgi:hypothetical protein
VNAARHQEKKVQKQHHLPARARRVLAALGLAAMAAQSVASCPDPSPAVRVTNPGEFSVVFGTQSLGKPNELPAEFWARWEGGLTAQRIPHPGKRHAAAEVNGMQVQGRIYPVLSSAALDFGLSWSYADTVETRLDGKPYYLSRKELQDFPDLLARFKAARIRFDKVVIDMVADVPGGGMTLRTPFTVTLPYTHFFVPNEGEPAISGPASPDRWTERIQLAAPGEKGWLSEEDLPAQWKKITAVRCASVTVWGLRTPQHEFEAIAKALEEAKKDTAKRDKDYAVLKDGLGKAVPPAYTRGGELGKPFAIPITTAEGFRTKDGVGLKKDGKTLWESGDYDGISRVDKEGRFHRVSLKIGRKFRIVDARGRVQKIGGVTDFTVLDTSQMEQGRLRLGAYQPTPAFETKKARMWGPVLTAAELDAFLSSDGDGSCRKSGGKEGVLEITAKSRHRYAKGTLYTVDLRMKPIKAGEEAYFSYESVRGRAGDRYCEEP